MLRTLVRARGIHHFHRPGLYGPSMPRPKQYTERRVATAIRLPESLRDRLRQTADARQVSVNLLVTKAVDDYLARLTPVDEIVQVG
jgi:hypothetical protein